MKQLFGGGTPAQNYGEQAQNMTNAENTAFANNQKAVDNSLNQLSQWLAANPPPISSWGSIAPPPQYGAGQTIGGGGTNALGQLVNPPPPGAPAPFLGTGAKNPAGPPMQRETPPGIVNPNGPPMQPGIGMPHATGINPALVRFHGLGANNGLGLSQ
jgi:hypothetical protein